jgi:hypothetical protein
MCFHGSFQINLGITLLCQGGVRISGCPPLLSQILIIGISTVFAWVSVVTALVTSQDVDVPKAIRET